MTDKKKTMYEVLEVSPNASLDDIKAAHRRLTQSLAAGTPPLNPEEMKLRRQVLNLAFDTLANQVNRDAYDAKLAGHSPSAAATSKANATLVPQGLDARTILTLASLEGARGSAKDLIVPPAVKVMASTVDKSASVLWKILRIVAGVLVLIILVNVASAIMKGRQAKQPGGALSEAEEKVMLQEYYQQHGIRPANKAELDLLETERQRKLNEQRAAELEQKSQDDAYRRFVQDSRRTADQVSRDLRRDEEIARRQEEQERRQQEREKQRQEYEKRLEEEAERNRVREARRRAGLPN
jgi:curved DNA-binding protein CbpA